MRDFSREEMLNCVNMGTKDAIFSTWYWEVGQRTEPLQVRKNIVLNVSAVTDVPDIKPLQNVLERYPVKGGFLSAGRLLGKTPGFALTERGMSIIPLNVDNIFSAKETEIPPYRTYGYADNKIACYSPVLLNAEIIETIYEKPGIETGRLAEIMKGKGLFRGVQETDIPIVMRCHMEFFRKDGPGFPKLVEGSCAGDNGENRLTEKGVICAEGPVIPGRLYWSEDGETVKRMLQQVEMLRDMADRDREDYFSAALDTYMPVSPYGVSQNSGEKRLRVIAAVNSGASGVELDEITERLKKVASKGVISSILKDLEAKGLVYTFRPSAGSCERRTVFYDLHDSFRRYIEREGLSVDSVRKYGRTPTGDL
jgi:hypothetical protein